MHEIRELTRSDRNEILRVATAISFDDEELSQLATMLPGAGVNGANDDPEDAF